MKELDKNKDSTNINHTKEEEQPESTQTKNNTDRSPSVQIAPQNQLERQKQLEASDNNQLQNVSEIIQELKKEMETSLIIWRGTDPTMRHILPKLQFKKDTKILDAMNKEIITGYIDESSTLEEIHTVTYAAASAILICNNQKNLEHQNTKLNHTKTPRWQKRIEGNITKLRADIGRLTQHTNGNKSKRIAKHVENIIENRKQTITETLDTLKQKFSTSTKIQGIQ